MGFVTLQELMPLRMKPGPKALLIALAFHKNEHTGRCDPSLSLLSQETCIGLRSLSRYIDQLVEAGAITLSGGNGRRYSFQINNPCQIGTPVKLAPLPTATETPAKQTETPATAWQRNGKNLKNGEEGKQNHSDALSALGRRGVDTKGKPKEWQEVVEGLSGEEVEAILGHSDQPLPKWSSEFRKRRQSWERKVAAADLASSDAKKRDEQARVGRLVRIDDERAAPIEKMVVDLIACRPELLHRDGVRQSVIDGMRSRVARGQGSGMAVRQFLTAIPELIQEIPHAAEFMNDPKANQSVAS
jgi:hypothetical protein